MLFNDINVAEINKVTVTVVDKYGKVHDISWDTHNVDMSIEQSQYETAKITLEFHPIFNAMPSDNLVATFKGVPIQEITEEVSSTNEIEW